MNTRDEPHADPQKYRRLHVIVGDANLCEVATFLKVGATAIVLAMIEDGFIDKDLSISGPVPAMRAVSHDPTCRATVDVTSLGRCSAIEVQWEFLRLARKYADESGLEACGGDEIGGQVLDRWEHVLNTLERDPTELDGQLDWVTKLNLLRAYVDRDGLTLDRSEALAARPSIPRRASSTVPLRASRPRRQGRTPPRRGRRTDRHGRSARNDPGVLPWHVPGPLGRLRGRRELGQSGPRCRQRSAAEDPNDGAHAW